MITTVRFSENFFTLRTDPKAFKVDDFIDECTIPYQLYNENFNKNLVVELNELQGKTLLTDQIKLGQIIQNLLSNAYKHSKGHSVSRKWRGSLGFFFNR
ncbi:HAMP domain-containing histidine kinase [Chitinophaga pinensis]|uniref:HAMP domain-containing histidine kinase n=1 Tax=Chitinophaga pinensis TaxID=79329 RepID=A0A5C6LUB9_9BACT|nr:HAMP domain-containing histidine kinase [Chitinophaga pinensis]TWV99328.1 HAMP domain-containing histidine kinase [Chitinophaga pinensis]